MPELKDCLCPHYDTWDCQYYKEGKCEMRREKMQSLRAIYDKELGLDKGAEYQEYTPLEVVILDSSTVRMFVYEVCKKMLKEDQPCQS